MLLSTLLVVTQLLAAGSSPTPKANPGPAAALVAPAVAGRVTNEVGVPLPGVFVAVQGTPQATSTNAAGDFLLALTGTKSVLLFKCQGYRDQTLAVAAGNSLTVKMQSLTKAVAPPAGPVPVAPAPEAEAANANTVLKFSEVLPSFPGGESAYYAFVRQTAHFPEEALKQGLSGTVYVSFVVDQQGRIVDAEVAKGCGHGFDEEALRVIRLMPWWTPGLVAGKPVRVARTMSVPFLFRSRD
ncbi:TonB family protein [Hymenobacter negativus]|uniref:TonB family protein n=1 Tax=Hymenobacter negativus TaxID=2795026 RepID=A0ABS0Q6J4_9BACT|nr:TonB family protein [Hymenobacter negativus]MBH8558284.1 TonB family protein [Hymenobacter negativus]